MCSVERQDDCSRHFSFEFLSFQHIFRHCTLHTQIFQTCITYGSHLVVVNNVYEWASVYSDVEAKLFGVFDLQMLSLDAECALVWRAAVWNWKSSEMSRKKI